ncbi:MAG: class I SAM-dependent RNA methyltransferase [Chitinophagales bacterium]|nr:class I SAM-dependent RNA methyltransferase [Chitinophagales bacterium]
MKPNLENFPDKSTIVISCAPHISPYLKAELASLNFSTDSEAATSISLTGSFDDCIKLNLQLFTASHVFFLIDQFKCSTLEELYEGIKKIAWENLIEEEGYFSVHSITNSLAVTNTMFLNVKVKDAIADRFMEKLNCRPYSGSDKDRTVIFVFWKDGEALVYLDTTGESLTKHGYRKLSAKAPLQESLAAAMLLSTRWDRKSTIVNPMCGGGTLAIEAALIAIKKPPGLIRKNFGFRHYKFFDENEFKLLEKEVADKAADKISFTIIATDNDEHTLNAARRNAELAGVSHLIEFSNCNFENTPVPEEKGIVIFNPPYGERLGSVTELEETYKGIGSFLKKNCSGYFGYVLTGNMELANHIGLKPKSKKTFFNGTLECKLLEYEMYLGTKKQPRESIAPVE